VGVIQDIYVRCSHCHGTCSAVGVVQLSSGTSARSSPLNAV
jgi:hypothetical protein